MKPRGLYESLLTQALNDLLRQLPDTLHAVDEPLRPADAPDRLGLHIGRAAQRALEDQPGKERVTGTYVKQENEAPMAITWRLRYPLPGDLFEQFAAAVAQGA